MWLCRHCGANLEIEGKIEREETCPECGAYLHSCLHCEFYDESSHNRCREPDAEWVSDKEKSNFCQFFRFSRSGEVPTHLDRRRKAKEELKRLFGGE